MRHAPHSALLAGLLAVALAATAWAGFDEGFAAYEGGDYDAALEEWQPLADEGDAKAQYFLGNMHFNGRGVPPDLAEAARLYRLAAQQEHVEARRNLGLMYRNGWGVPPDHTEAARWMRLAAEQGDPDAQYDLGFMILHGQGVSRNREEARRWYRLAAAQGHSEAQRKLTDMHDEDQSVRETQRSDMGDFTMTDNPSEWFGVLLDSVIGSGDTMSVGFILAIAAIVLIIVLPVVMPFSFYRIKPLMQQLADEAAERDRALLEECRKVAPLLRQLADSAAERDQAMLEEFRTINRALNDEVVRYEAAVRSPAKDTLTPPTK